LGKILIEGLQIRHAFPDGLARVCRDKRLSSLIVEERERTQNHRRQYPATNSYLRGSLGPKHKYRAGRSRQGSENIFGAIFHGCTNPVCRRSVPDGGPSSERPPTC
jgi:hypothetical protein